MHWFLFLLFFRKRDVGTYSREQVDDYLLWSLPDTLLYAHFNRTFWARVEAMGAEDFNQEVQDLNLIQEQTMDYCNSVAKEDKNVDKSLRNSTSIRPTPLFFQQTQWNPSFSITESDCHLIHSNLRDEVKHQYDIDPVMVKQPKQPTGVNPGCW